MHGLILFISAAVGWAAEPAAVSDNPVMEIQEFPENGKKPRAIKLVPPKYPKELVQSRTSGTVAVSFVIDKGGGVRDARIIESSNPQFEQPALEAVGKWTFVPGEIEGRPVSTRVNQRIEFHPEAGQAVEKPDSDTNSRQVGRPAASGDTAAAGKDEKPAALDIRRLPKNSKKPKALKQGPPVYPYELARAGLIGAVGVNFIIDRQGNVQNAYVMESNNPWFERAALDAVMKWKFSPAEVEGQPVSVQVSQLIQFNLSPGGQAPELWKISKGKEHDKLPPEYQWETPPTPKLTMFPVYPFEQLKAGTSGKVSMRFIIGPKGRVLTAKIDEATTPEFGQAVLAMMDAWQFKPAKKKDGTPAYANFAIKYEFKAQGRGDVPVSEAAREILRDLEKRPEKIVTLKELDRPLKPLSRRPPVYPTALKEAGQDGKAVIEFFVDRQGDAQLPQIISSTATEFGYAAVQAVATWRFEAPKKAGKAVVVRARIPIEFSMHEPAPPEQK